jgi:hypothetical protein
VKTIPRSDYYKLVGLLTIAAQHEAALKEIEKATLSITGDEENGHTSDAVYGSRTVDELLKLLKITVVD